MQGTGWSLNLFGRDANGKNVQLDANGNIVFRSGRLAYTNGDGFKANSPVKVYIFSTPILLGNLTTDAAGSFEGQFNLPSGLEPGAHTVQVDGFAPDGSVRTANVPVIYATAKPATVSLNLYFEPDSAKLTGATKSALHMFVAGIPAAAEDLKISTKGYVYPIRNKQSNTKVSTARARNVAAALKAAGVSAIYSAAGLGRLPAKSKASRKVVVNLSYNQYTAFAN